MDIVQYIIDQIPFWTDILLPALIDGLWVTLQLVALTAPFGFLLGFFVAGETIIGNSGVQPQETGVVVGVADGNDFFP